MEEPYQYDVAISFLAKDEELAVQIKEALAPLNVFVYSKAQEKVAGTEGVEAFREVFRNQARLPLILCRSGWGATGWTGVEEAAIRDKCLEQGWKHLMVVKLDEGKVPSWIPDSHIYLNYRSFGLTELVGAVKARCAELGIEIIAPSAADRARRIAVREKFLLETKHALQTSRRPFDDAARKLFEALRQSLTHISQETEWEVRFGAEGLNHFAVHLEQVSAQLLVRDLYENNCASAFFLMRVFRGHIGLANEPTSYGFNRPSEIKREEVAIARTQEHGWCWKYLGKIVSSDEMAEIFVEALLAARNQEPDEDYQEDEDEPFEDF